MRRGISILLALIFSVGPLSSVLPGAEDAALPLCCRRHGAHHCAMYARMEAMMAAMERDGKQHISAPDTCPYYPGPTFALLLPAMHALTAEIETPPAAAFGARAPLPADSADLSGPNPTYAGRGPPTALPG